MGDIMLKKIKNKDDLDIEKINESVSLLSKILKLGYILLVIMGIFFLLRLCQELGIKDIVITILKILSPLFIGLFIAWLFAPFVKMLNRKGVRRGIGTFITYLLFVGVIVLILGSIIPLLLDQINDFAKMLPSVFETLKEWLNNIFDNLNTVEGVDAIAIRDDIFAKIETYGTGLVNSLPEILVNIVKSFFSGIGTFVVGLIIGFFLLIGFDNAGELLITLLPKNMQKDARDISNEMNTSLRRFVNGALLDCMFVFIITTIAFWIIGLKAPVLFGLFCGITNIIPYAGPYIGGAPAVLVGFSQGTVTGIFTLVAVVLIQFLEGNFLQPVIMSKTTKLHPVTIIIGLLIFGHFFGILGMAISTPVIAVLKAAIMFFIDKYHIFGE